MTKQKKSSKMNSNKTISVNGNGIIISYIDSNKHQFISYENRDYPKFISPKYQEIEKPVFNERQHKMYLEALYGLSVFPEELVNRMPKKVAMKIATRCTEVQKEINRWKQEIVNDKIDRLLLAIFPNSPLVKKMINIGTDDEIKCTISFKDLGINQLKVANKLISLSLLPKNFFQIA